MSQVKSKRSRSTTSVRFNYKQRRKYQYIEDDFKFQFLISTKLSSSMDTHKNKTKKICQLTDSLRNFQFEIKLLRNQN